MKLLKGKNKSTMVDISDEELKSMFDSWVADTQMTRALIGLSDKEFGINVIIPEGQTISQIKGSLKTKTTTVERFIKEFKEKINVQS